MDRGCCCSNAWECRARPGESAKCETWRPGGQASLEDDVRVGAEEIVDSFEYSARVGSEANVCGV